MTHILDTVEPLDVLWRAVCRSPLGFVEFCDGNYEAADQAWTKMREEAELIGWKDFLEDRSEPDHVEVLLLLGDLNARAARPRAPGVARTDAAAPVDRRNAPACPGADPRCRRRRGGRS